jgi:hypothetical protein
MMRAIHLRAAEAFQREIARHFQDEVADEEDAGAETVGLRIDADRLVHLQRGSTDVDAIDVTNDICRQQKWHQPPGDRAHGARFQCPGGDYRGRHRLLRFDY